MTMPPSVHFVTALAAALVATTSMGDRPGARAIRAPTADDAACREPECAWDGGCVALPHGPIAWDCRMGRRRVQPDESDFAPLRYHVYFARTNAGPREVGRVLVYDGPIDVPDDAAYEALERPMQMTTDAGNLLVLPRPGSCWEDSFRLEGGRLRENAPRRSLRPDCVSGDNPASGGGIERP